MGTFRFLGRFLAPLLLLAALAPPAESADTSGAKHCPLEPLTIETAAGSHEIQVEVARSQEQRATGLMHRTELPSDQGMLFDFAATREVAMWMRNTLISLDMFFVEDTGRIVKIALGTTPLSEKKIRSGRPVRFVLEMIAGSAARLGVEPGDYLRHPLFDAASGG
jgi:uncharacterized membrane protein (UPF0127 family)